MPHLGQLAGKTEGVVHAAVHAHATRGTVKVGRVTGQKHPALAIAGGDALVNAIGAPLQHRVGLVARHDGLQRRLYRRRLQRLLDRAVLGRVNADAP